MHRHHNITSRYQSEPTIIELTEPNQHFYLCSVDEHCEVRQKLVINVTLIAPPSDTDIDNYSAA